MIVRWLKNVRRIILPSELTSPQPTPTPPPPPPASASRIVANREASADLFPLVANILYPPLHGVLTWTVNKCVNVYQFFRCDLVPVFGFGQNNLYHHFIGGSSCTRYSRPQIWFRNFTSCLGTCFLPGRSPINVVGKRIFH